MGQFNEMSLDRLYSSTLMAFPSTMKRQHATDTIKVVKMDWTPFVGMKTLFVKGLVENEGRIYDTIMLFKGVNYDVEINTGNAIPMVASDGMLYHLDKIDERASDVLVRCNCPDFKWRFAFQNSRSGVLWGNTPAKYESKGIGPSANPLKKEGMCKHIMKTTRALSRSGIFV